jgi:putative membrane protein
MSERDFYQQEAKSRAAAAVRAVEALTSAEVVVAVRRVSGDYRAAAYHFGLGAMGVVVGYLLVAPQTYSIAAIVVDGALAFFCGAVLARNFDALARLLVPRSRRQARVDAAARAAFYDLGISRTTGRNGILVFISTFERVCSVVPDIGVDVAALGAPWQRQLAAMSAAVRRPNLSAFLAALEGLGPILGAALPRAEDDVNELPDEVQ